MGHLPVAGRKGTPAGADEEEGMGLEALGMLEASSGVCEKTAAYSDSARGTAWGVCGKFMAFPGRQSPWLKNRPCG